MSDTTGQLTIEEKNSSNIMDPQPDPDIKDNGAESEDAPPIKKAKLNNDVNEKKDESPIKGRGSKSEKRLSLLARTAQEGEALLKTLGHKSDDDPDGTRRRTRSQTRGTPAPPPPVKKTAPKIQKSADKNDSTTPKRRGRPPKNVANAVENNASHAKDVKSLSQELNNKDEASSVANDNNNDDSICDADAEEHKEEESIDESEGVSCIIEKNNDEQTFESSSDFESKPKSNSADTSNSTEPPPVEAQ